MARSRPAVGQEVEEAEGVVGARIGDAVTAAVAAMTQTGHR
jgi:hypothetical protein